MDNFSSEPKVHHLLSHFLQNWSVGLSRVPISAVPILARSDVKFFELVEVSHEAFWGVGMQR